MIFHDICSNHDIKIPVLSIGCNITYYWYSCGLLPIVIFFFPSQVRDPLNLNTG